MSEPIDFQAIKDKLETKGSIFILFGADATIDHVASALALFLTLKKAGKDVLVASPSEMRAEFTYLVGLDKIGKSIGNRNLVISFKDYAPGSVDKVSHNDDISNKFELTIAPKSGHKAPDPKNIEYSFSGAQADLIFIIGTSRLEDLGPIYESERNLFNTATTVAINRRQGTTYANINVIDNQASSLAEIVTELVSKLDLTVEDDIASNLLSGLDFATNRFQNPLISSNAFATAGQLIKSGGKRPPQRISSSTQLPTRFSPPGASPLTATKSFAQALASSAPQVTPPNPLSPPHPASQPTLPQPQTQPTFPPPPPTPPASAQPQTQPQTDPNQPADQSDQKPPKDWMEPKIYKGSSRV